MPTAFYSSEGVVEVPVSDSSVESLQIIKISGSAKSEYRADALHTKHPAQTARLTEPDHAENLCALVRESS